MFFVLWAILYSQTCSRKYVETMEIPVIRNDTEINCLTTWIIFWTVIRCTQFCYINGSCKTCTVSGLYIRLRNKNKTKYYSTIKAIFSFTPQFLHVFYLCACFCKHKFVCMSSTMLVIFLFTETFYITQIYSKFYLCTVKQRRTKYFTKWLSNTPLTNEINWKRNIRWNKKQRITWFSINCLVRN